MKSNRATRFINWAAALLLAYLTLEILLRRWISHQVPTQVSLWFVYLLVILNFIWLSYASPFAGHWLKKGKKLNH